jgi:ABC-type glutathione transport system ATPase component
MQSLAPAIEVAGLRKDYGNVRAVDDLSFTVGWDEVFGLLGPNGAGKTTTVEILEGYRHPDAGHVRRLSGGKAQRLLLALALIGCPALVFLTSRPRVSTRARVTRRGRSCTTCGSGAIGSGACRWDRRARPRS